MADVSMEPRDRKMSLSSPNPQSPHAMSGRPQFLPPGTRPPFAPRPAPASQSTMQKLHCLTTSGTGDAFSTNRIPPARLSAITFGPQSDAEIRSQSVVDVHLNTLAVQNGSSWDMPSHGLLDPKMGVNLRAKKCGTCGKQMAECPGHFGHLQLYYPLFHMGYFKNVFQIMQSVCQSCSRVLLHGPQRISYLSKANKPMTLAAKKDLRKKIVELCKKQKICQYCLATQTDIRRFGYYRMVMDVLRPAATQRKLLPHIVHTADVPSLEPGTGDQPRADLGTAKILLNPVYVLKVLRKIPLQDHPLLLCGKISPESFLMSCLQFPPVPIRPTVMQEEGTVNQDDITVAISGVLHWNQLLKEKIDRDPVRSNLESWENMQWNYNKVLNGSAKDPVSGSAGTAFAKPSKGFEQRLKGKQGRFRGNLNGKRVNFSGRTVISPDPNLRLDEVGIPVYMAKILTFPIHVTEKNIETMRILVRNGSQKHPGADKITKCQLDGSSYSINLHNEKIAREQAHALQIGDVVERHLQNGDPVLFNRQPSLHKMSIMCHKARVLPSRTLRFNECVCTPYNADFDGDEMNVHVPQTYPARAEAETLMLSTKNILTPRNGEVIIGAHQDFITGSYLLSNKDNFFTRAEFDQLVSQMLVGKERTLKIDWPLPAIVKPEKLWTGKQVLSVVLCPNRERGYGKNAHELSGFLNVRTKGKNYTKNEDLCSNDSFLVIHNGELMAGTFDKNNVGTGSRKNLFCHLFHDCGSAYAADVIYRLTRVTAYFLTHRGFSIGIEDVSPSAALIQTKKEHIKAAYRKCEDLIDQLKRGVLENRPGCTKEETLESGMVQELSTVRDRMGKICFDSLPKTNAPLIMAQCGSKGSVINISQMAVCVGQQVISGKRIPNGFEDRSLPTVPRYSKEPLAKGFVENSFFSGLTPSEFFFHTMAGREGLVDTAVKTAETGYMQRRLIKCLEDVIVHYDRTVRNSVNEVIQLRFGEDGLDPASIEDEDYPIDLEHRWRHAISIYPFNSRLDKHLSRWEVKMHWDRAVPTMVVKLGGQTFAESSSEVKYFLNNLEEFLKKKMAKMDADEERYGPVSHSDVQCDDRLYRHHVIEKQLNGFFGLCIQKRIKSHVEPGTAVGALCSQSIGEPGTQMTLKTFHFAGVASMNITLGVPRITEIINATTNIRTPIITTFLTNKVDERFARLVKAQLERTMLSDVTLIMSDVLSEDQIAVVFELAKDIIRSLLLPVNAQKIAVILKTHPKTSKLIRDVECYGNWIVKALINDDDFKGKKVDRKSAFLGRAHELRRLAGEIVVAGLPTASRAVIHKQTEDDGYRLLVDGTDLRAVLGLQGVNSNKTYTNNCMEIFRVLGVEAGRASIIQEVMYTMKSHGMSIDWRHYSLLADTMTARGNLYGFTRYGMAKMKDSALMLASFEQTVDHLYDAAYYGVTDDICGVSESVILGQDVRVGTGICKILPKTSSCRPGANDLKKTFNISAMS
ncbi:DNA-directed RNA polymerase III subunit RPC1-like [Paramacrobiotus metropolitanus]|uniref:DNA-directed RNA polymerase III subunit RPC1-like n=1 Tax=Paramacrobiotus metropolitanus TaxID=2943436 RepID=UPI002445CA4A|nr:DNA-directed RNA polymerase III subunit RPC1-like [Paramacrobiotus metropolitanus]